MRTALAIALVLIAAPASAHGGRDRAIGWTFDPVLLVPLGLTLAIFLVGWRNLSKRASQQNGRPVLFLAGWTVLTLALVSPLHAAGEQSFTMHMIEHELIMLVATLLLAASGVGATLAWGLPRPLRLAIGSSAMSPLRRLWRRLTEPLTATAIQAVVMWGWHAPLLFDRALESDRWHIAQHASFFLSALLFWWAMLHPRGRDSGYGVSAACLFVTSLAGGALGALMSVSQSPWYADYAKMGVSGIGLDPTTDQQLAGLVMWIPGGLVHGLAAMLMFYKWLKSAEEDGRAVALH